MDRQCCASTGRRVTHSQAGACPIQSNIITGPILGGQVKPCFRLRKSYLAALQNHKGKMVRPWVELGKDQYQELEKLRANVVQMSSIIFEDLPGDIESYLLSQMSSLYLLD